METKELMAKLMMRAYPHPNFGLVHAEMITDYLISHGVGFQDIKKTTETLETLESVLH